MSEKIQSDKKRIFWIWTIRNTIDEWKENEPLRDEYRGRVGRDLSARQDVGLFKKMNVGDIIFLCVKTTNIVDLRIVTGPGEEATWKSGGRAYIVPCGSLIKPNWKPRKYDFKRLSFYDQKLNLKVPRRLDNQKDINYLLGIVGISSDDLQLNAP
jgi:hypothetical protein